MSGTLEIDHKKMHDIKSAADLAGYSRDHVTSLARTGKIVAAQIGRQWYIDVDSLKQYAQITALEQEVKQKHLSEERRSTHEKSSVTKARRQKRDMHVKQHSRRLHVNLAGFLIMLGFATGVMSQFAPEWLGASGRQLASTKVPTASVVSNLAIPDDLKVAIERTSFSDGAVKVSVLAESSEAIVILPNGVSDAAAVFSDEVVVRKDNGSTTLEMVETGRIVPLGIVTVPITERPKL
jgi:hypothetical protein